MNENPVIVRAALRGEEAIGVVRTVFCALILLRFLLLGEYLRGGAAIPRLLVEVPLLAAGIALSPLVVRLARRGRLGPRALLASALADAILCFSALLPNLLWPADHYRGILRMPDAAALVVVAVSAGFRLSPRIAGIAGAVHAASLAVLVVVDRSLNAARLAYGSMDVALFAVFLGAAVILAVSTALRTRSLVTRASLESARAERAKRHLGVLMREHHDVKSLISSAMLNAEQLAAAAPQAPQGAALKGDLLELATFASGVKDRAFAELAAADDLRAVPLSPVVDAARGVVARRFPGVEVAHEGARSATVRVVGGEPALSRVMTNLLVNACEGDGARAAQRIVVRADVEDSGVVIVVDDDGPGFAPPLLDGAVVRCVSTKKGGTGLGLLLAVSVVEASGGALSRGASPQGGARVTVRLSKA